MLKTLTALRFPAALAVFLSHAALTRPAAMALSSGSGGVGFFFLLSGFILTFNYRDGLDLRRFFAARFARVYPVHICGMVLALTVLALYGGGPEWNNASSAERFLAAGLQAVLLQSWYPSAHIYYGGNGPAWSLSDEAFFYSLFPFALSAIAFAFRRHRAATLLLAAGAIWALLTATLAGVEARFAEFLYVFPPTRFVDFFIGMLLGSAFVRSKRDARWPIDGTTMEVAALCGLAIGVALTAYAPPSLQFSAAMMPFSAAVIFIFAYQRGAISRFLSSPFLVRLGEASYAFYLLHRPIARAVEVGLHLGGGVASFLLALAVSVALSLAAFEFVETPLRRIIRNRLAPAEPAGSAANVRAYAAGLRTDAAR